MRKHVFSVENSKLFPGLFPCFALDTPGFSLLAAAPVVTETPKERRARQLAMFEIEEKREKRGALQRLANSEGLDHSNLSKDIKRAKAEREEEKRAGRGRLGVGFARVQQGFSKV